MNDKSPHLHRRILNPAVRIIVFPLILAPKAQDILEDVRIKKPRIFMAKDAPHHH